MSQTPPRPDALIFDMDGTLLDTEPLYSVASQRVLDEFGEIYSPALKRRTMGGDSRNSAQIVIDEFSLPIDADEYLKRREVHLLELFRNCAEIQGAGAFISAAANAGVRQGLATSSHRHLREIKLDGKDWAAHFEATVCGDHPDLVRGKPAPDIFLLCASALDVQPARCIAFEDSRNGIAAAAAAGMTVVAVNSPFVEADDLAEANYVIDAYADAMSWVEDWRRQAGI